MIRLNIECDSAQEFEQILSTLRGDSKAVPKVRESFPSGGVCEPRMRGLLEGEHTAEPKVEKPSSSSLMDYSLAEIHAMNMRRENADKVLELKKALEAGRRQFEKDSALKAWVGDTPDKKEVVNPSDLVGALTGVAETMATVTSQEAQEAPKKEKTVSTRTRKPKAENEAVTELKTQGPELPPHEQSALDQADAMGIYNPATGEFTEEATVGELPTTPAVPTGKAITAEDLRGLCFPLNKKSAEAKAAVQKAIRATGAENFSSVPEDKFGQLYDELKSLCITFGIDPTTV